MNSILNERDIVRVNKAWNKLSHDKPYPVILGGDTNEDNQEVVFTLDDLLKIEAECDFNQVTYPNKVRDIIMKAHTGLVNTEFTMFEAPVVGTCFPGEYYIISGRHRVKALQILFDLLSISYTTEIPVRLRKFESDKMLGQYIEAANTTRSMTPTEKERIRMSLDNGGDLPNVYTVTDFTRTKSGTKKVFKQLMLTQVKASERDLMTEHNICRVIAKVYDWLMSHRNPEDELFNSLKQGDESLWVALEEMFYQAADAGIFDQPLNGNISRQLQYKYDEAILYCDGYLMDNLQEDEPIEQSETTEERDEWDNETEPTDTDAEEDTPNQHRLLMEIVREAYQKVEEMPSDME